MSRYSDNELVAAIARCGDTETPGVSQQGLLMRAWQEASGLAHGVWVSRSWSCEPAVIDRYSCGEETAVDIPEQTDTCTG